jgi:AcrR family transcriptional regulator
VSNDAILAATAGVISRVGPAQLTLAAVARDAGLAAPTLVQRFGSKRDLLLAFASQASDGVAEMFAAARRRHRSPLTALRAGLVQMASVVASPEALANHLAFLQLELADDEFREHTARHARAVLAELRLLLREAAAAGELRDRDPARLAQAVYVTYNGALITWAILRTGSLDRWIDRELRYLLS